MNRLFQRLGRLRWAIVCATLVGGISIVDYYSGPDLTFSLFYFAVIILFAWKTGAFRAAIIAAFSIAAVWLAAERFTLGAPNEAVLAWNASMRLIMLVGLAVIIVRFRQLLSSAQAMARSDFLTKALNARAFAEQAAFEISRARRYRKPLTVAYVDIDDFKTVNDRYGHSFGDDVLRSVASSLKAHLRSSDSIARVGGDEFVILLPETDHQSAQSVLSKLHAVLTEAMAAAEPRVTLSIGAVAFDEPPAEVESLTKASDSMMYSAKTSGKNRLFVHPVNRLDSMPDRRAG